MPRATLTYVAGVIRRHRRQIGSCWRKCNPGQQALCDAGFEATSNTFTPSNGCSNTLKALYAAVGGAQHTYMTPFSQQVATGQVSFTARFRQAFHL